MKKILSALFTAMMLFCVLSLYADQVSDDIADMVKNRFGIDITQYGKSAKKTASVSTNVITYQYTSDGWLQHVAVYADSVICTNVEGPREGAQFIIMNNGALMDMCNSYKIRKEYCEHKYSWGEVRTYKNDYQTVILK